LQFVSRSVGVSLSSNFGKNIYGYLYLITI